MGSAWDPGTDAGAYELAGHLWFLALGACSNYVIRFAQMGRSGAASLQLQMLQVGLFVTCGVADFV